MNRYMKMGYYEVLEVIERLERDKIEITPKVIKDNVSDCSERSIQRTLNIMISDGTLRRSVVYLQTGKRTVYYLEHNRLTNRLMEGFINDFFKTIIGLIH